MEVASSFVARMNPLPMFGVKPSTQQQPGVVPSHMPPSNERLKQKARKRISTKQLEKPYLECKWDKCGQIFRSTLELKDHLEDHLGRGNSKYICLWEDCNFGERRKRDHMKSHIRKHHQHIGFHCTKCGMGFVRDQELRQHSCGQSQGCHSSESSDESETIPTTSSPGYPTSPPTSSDIENSISSPARDVEPSLYYYSNQVPLQNPNYGYNSNPNSMGNGSYCQPEQHLTLKRERSYEDVLSWISEMDQPQDIQLTPSIFYKMDHLMEKFDQEPACFDEYIELLKPHTSYFKRIRQNLEDYKISHDEDIIALLESNQQTSTQPSQPIQVTQVPIFNSHLPEQAHPGVFSNPSVGHIESFNDEIYINNDPHTVQEAQVAFSSNPEFAFTFKKKGEEDSDTSSNYTSDYVSGDDEDSEDEDYLADSLNKMKIQDKPVHSTTPHQALSKPPNRKLKEYLDFIEVITSFGS